jgi:hypothetical protein
VNSLVSRYRKLKSNSDPDFFGGGLKISNTWAIGSGHIGSSGSGHGF